MRGEDSRHLLEPSGNRTMEIQPLLQQAFGERVPVVPGQSCRGAGCCAIPPEQKASCPFSHSCTSQADAGPALLVLIKQLRQGTSLPRKERAEKRERALTGLRYGVCHLRGLLGKVCCMQRSHPAPCSDIKSRRLFRTAVQEA